MPVLLFFLKYYALAPVFLFGKFAISPLFVIEYRVKKECKMPVLIVAMKNEADAVLGQSELLEESILFGRRVFHARAFGTEFSLVLSGIGKSNAAAAAMRNICSAAN